MYESSDAAAIATWGPSLIILLAVLLAALLFIMISRRELNRAKLARIGFVSSMSHNFDELKTALESAATINKFDVHAGADPGVRLGSVLRFAPRDYQNSVAEILLGFREGRVLAIDLAKMDNHQAARLVDFCSGMAAAGSGWIYHVTESVIILTPYT